MFCTKCGKTIPEGSKFCPSCGQTVSAPQANPAPSPEPVSGPVEKKKKTATTIALAVGIPVVFLLVALIAILIFQRVDRKGNSSDASTLSAPQGAQGGDAPVLDEVVAESFPTVRVTLRGEAPATLTRSGIRVTENGVERPVTDFSAHSGGVTFAYLSDGSAASSETRQFTYTVEWQGGAVSGSGSYTTPYFEEAQVRLVSTDVSAYPVIKAYFRVERGDGQAVSGLDSGAFVIQERVQGGAYLAREIRAVSSLDRQGLNIDLVADKSGSMYANMPYTKQVMTEFIAGVDYAKGDRVEVLAFDDIVQQMCSYTGDQTLLVNGINNMSPEGETALYNALYDGIQNASLQGGARCVIAFTDGMDNVGGHTPQDVIHYANAVQVPVYIVGVGADGSSDSLRDIAERTGGRYWSIDDLYDLEYIYGQIYAEQQELYMVEYVSDAYADQYSYRDLSVSVTGEGCRGAVETGFTPTRSLGGQVHSSRYELVKESLSWEDASRRCREMGGHLATVTSLAEEQQLIAMAEAQGVKYVWLGGHTSYDSMGNVFGQWVTGEAFTYSHWTPGEPSRLDQDGTPERYIMLWYVHNEWAWNDQRNDPAAAVPSMAKGMGFVCEYES